MSNTNLGQESTFDAMNTQKILSRIASISLISIATLVLYGWTINNEILKRIIPDLIQMNPFSAVFFIIFGIFLFLQTYKKSRFVKLFRILFCVDIIIFCLILLLKYFFNSDLHIDELLFRSKLEGNRMAFSTATCFLITSIVFLCIDMRSNRMRIALEIALVLIIFIASHGVFFELYNLTGFSQSNIFIPMALNVSLCFFILCIGVLNLRSNFEIRVFVKNLFSDSTVKIKINIFLCLSLIFIATNGIVAYTNTSHLVNSSDALAKKIQKIKLRSQLFNELVNAESAQRGYLLTGQGDYLVPYAQSTSTYPTTFQDLLKLANSPEDAKLLHQIDALAQQKFMELATTINIRRSKSLGSAQLIVKSNKGKDYMDQIRDINEQLDILDQRELAKLSKTDSIATKRSISAMVVSSVLGFILIILAIIFINRNLLKQKGKEIGPLIQKISG